jgi:hypothetical protein
LFTVMDPEITKLALVVALLTGGLTVALYILARKGRRRVERLRDAFELGTARSAGLLGSAIDGLYRGYSCRYQVQYASQYDRGGASLRVSAVSPHPWTAELSKPGVRLLTRFGLLKDFEIGDRELDEHLRFSSNDEVGLRSLFGTEAVRDALHVLASSENFESVRARKEKMDVRWSPRMPRLDEDPKELRARLEYVIALVQACGYSPAHHTSAH